MTAQTVTVTVPFTIRKRGGRKLVITPDGTAQALAPRAHVDSALLKALARGFRWRRLLEAGADVNVRGALEMTPLMIAAQDGNLILVKTLIQKGAAVHAQNIVGQTALRLAMLREREAVVAVLRSAGAVE